MLFYFALSKIVDFAQINTLQHLQTANTHLSFKL